MAEFKRYVLMFLVLMTFAACQPNDEGEKDVSSGHIQILATDAPFNYENVTSARITISKIDMREKSGNYVIVHEGDRTLDLVQLKNGLTETLADIDIPVGEYDQIRLVIESASVDLQDGRHFDLTVPSGSSSGLKVFVNPTINVTSSVSQSLLLDFDLSRSFVAQGPADDFTGFTFKPVIRAANLTTAGTVSGSVKTADDAALSGAVVTLSDTDGTVITTAVTDSEGHYTMIGVPAGIYDMKATFDGYSTSETSGVNVTAGNVTTNNMTLGPLAP